MKVKTSWSLAMLVACACTSTFAASPHDITSLSDTPYVITVARTDSAPDFIPNQVNVITAKDIETHQYKTLGDALQTVPGLSFVNTISSGSNGGSNVSLRGMNPNHTLVLIDGQRITGDITRVKGVNLNYMLTELDNVDRIELLQGPSSALYGSEAMGGVINIVTKQQEKKGGSLHTEVTKAPNASGLGHNVAFSYGTGREGKWSASVNVGHLKMQPARDALGASLRYYGNSTPLRFGATYHINDKSELAFDYSYEHHNLTWDSVLLSPDPPSRAATGAAMGAIQTLPREDQLLIFKTLETNGKALQALLTASTTSGAGAGTPVDPNLYPGVKVGPAPNRFTVGSTFTRDGIAQSAGIRYKHTSDKVNTTLNLTWGHFNEYFTSSATTAFQPTLGSPSIPASIAAIMPPAIKKVAPDWSRAIHSEYGLEAQQMRSLNDKHLLSYGTSLRIEQGRGTRILTGTPAGSETHTVDGTTTTHPLYKATLREQAIYLQDEWQVNEKLYLVPALRYDYSSHFGGHWSPKLGITYLMTPTWRLKSNVGHGYATPGITELYENWTDGPIGQILGNPNLRPEVSNSYDVTVEHDMGRHHIALTYFNNHVQDLIDVKPNGEAGPKAGFTFQNIKRAHIQGITFSHRWALPPHWTTFLNYNYLDAQDTSTGLRLGNRAKHTIQAGVTYTKGAWQGSLWATMYRHYLEVPYYGPSVLHNYTSIDALASYTFTNQSRLYFGVTNLTNQKNALLGLAGRTYRIGYNVKF